MPDVVEYYISHLVASNVGKKEDYDMTWANILSAMVRLANRQRQDRSLKYDEVTGALKKKPKTGHLIDKKPGTPFYRHYDEVANKNDKFIEYFVDSDVMGDNPAFIHAINAIKASFLFIYFL